MPLPASLYGNRLNTLTNPHCISPTSFVLLARLWRWLRWNEHATVYTRMGKDTHCLPHCDSSGMRRVVTACARGEVSIYGGASKHIPASRLRHFGPGMCSVSSGLHDGSCLNFLHGQAGWRKRSGSRVEYRAASSQSCCPAYPLVGTASGLNHRRSLRFLLAFLAFAVMAGRAWSQQLPPPEPPRPIPVTAAEKPTVRVTTNEVLVPTLVEKRDGSILYGLSPGDFQVLDDGVPQKIHVQQEMDTAPVALVVAVEQGGASVLEFGKLARLGPLLDLFLADPQSRAALVGFDSEPHLLCDFTHSDTALNQQLEHLEPGDGGSAILDTVSYSVDLLETQPRRFRRVLLLISEKRDHGSRHTKIVQLVRKIGQSDVLVLSVSFSPARAEFEHDVKDSGEDRTMNMVSSLVMIVKAFKKNVAREVAEMSGGEYTTFAGDRGFEQRVVNAAKHIRNRYLITFSPSNASPGLHTLRVRTTQDFGARVVARTNYWLQSEP